MLFIFNLFCSNPVISLNNKGDRYKVLVFPSNAYVVLTQYTTKYYQINSFHECLLSFLFKSFLVHLHCKVSLNITLPYNRPVNPRPPTLRTNPYLPCGPRLTHPRRQMNGSTVYQQKVAVTVARIQPPLPTKMIRQPNDPKNNVSHDWSLIGQCPRPYLYSSCVSSLRFASKQR